MGSAHAQKEAGHYDQVAETSFTDNLEYNVVNNIISVHAGYQFHRILSKKRFSEIIP